MPIRLTPLFVTCAALTLAACHPAQPADNATATLPPAKVHVATVAAATTTLTRRLPGTVQAVARATVAAQTMGTVRRADFALGQRVAADDPLVVLEDAELLARADQAAAARDLATRNHDREAALLDQGASTAETVRTLADQQRIAAAQLTAAQAQLAYTSIRAPFDGTITQRFIEPGDLASPGSPLFAIEGSALEVQVNVPESLPAAPIASSIMVDFEDTVVAAQIREISSATNSTTRTRLVRLSLPSGVSAHAGQFVRVRWPDLTTTEVTVPASALTTFGQMQQVFVAVDGHATLRLVKGGRVSADSVTILAGLNPGEHVVLHPPAALRDGQALNVVQP